LGQLCVPITPCESTGECQSDSYCFEGQCIPYGLDGGDSLDASCSVEIEVEAVIPDVQCRFTDPPSGDAYPDHRQVMATPMVADLDLDNDPSTLLPSIVFPAWKSDGRGLLDEQGYRQASVLRIVSGSTCEQQFSVGLGVGNDTAVAGSAPVALGDLDGDGRPEIVARRHNGGLIAFRFNPTTGQVETAWKSRLCPAGSSQTPDEVRPADGNNHWAGPAIHDLDDDGRPEVILGATVWDAGGCRLSDASWPASQFGYIPVVADVDEDGKMELVQGNAVREWNSATNAWTDEPYFAPASMEALYAGHVAVAEFGKYPLASFGGQDRPEIVVVRGGMVRVQTIEGTVVFGPHMLTIGDGRGGAPTVADFDGDGRPEIGVANGFGYFVLDLDCIDGTAEQKDQCENAAKGIRWSRASQDGSSGVTGSSVFDFDFDGSAEVVYADECFLRVYNGRSGEVVFSAARSSGTTFENPVIADADGDYRTEIVAALTDMAGASNCTGVDPLMPSTTAATGYGIVVLKDVLDRWAASRPVWNQHAYAVTHVTDTGGIPRTSAVERNWSTTGLNNFRQNVQGRLQGDGKPDLTAGGTVGRVECDGTLANVQARICNRGTLPMVRGTEIAIYEGTQADAAKELCRVPVPVSLHEAECYPVSCQIDLEERTIDIAVLVDPDDATEECWEGNNFTVYRGVACDQIPEPVIVR
jgi:hypothetical protein